MKIRNLVCAGILMAAGAGVTLGIEELVAHFNPSPKIEIGDFTGKGRKDDIMVNFGRNRGRWLFDFQGSGVYEVAVEIGVSDAPGKSKFLNLHWDRFYIPAGKQYWLPKEPLKEWNPYD
jgi:hypothetical protein